MSNKEFRINYVPDYPFHTKITIHWVIDLKGHKENFNFINDLGSRFIMSLLSIGHLPLNNSDTLIRQKVMPTDLELKYPFETLYHLWRVLLRRLLRSFERINMWSKVVITNFQRGSLTMKGPWTWSHQDRSQEAVSLRRGPVSFSRPLSSITLSSLYPPRHRHIQCSRPRHWLRQVLRCVSSVGIRAFSNSW